MFPTVLGLRHKGDVRSATLSRLAPKYPRARALSVRACARGCAREPSGARLLCVARCALQTANDVSGAGQRLAQFGPLSLQGRNVGV